MSSTLLQPVEAVLTAEGRRRLQERLANLATELHHVEERIKARDASADALAARHAIGGQLDELRRTLARAADTAAVEEDPAIVEIGDEVDVDHLNGELETYAVVHPAEADAFRNQVSALAPLGKALLGARPGDRVAVHAPGGKYSLVVRARRRLP